MRIKLTLLTLLCIAMTALADTGVKGIVVDSRTGKPVADANVLLRERAIFVVTGSDGVFTISNTSPGEDIIDIIKYLFFFSKSSKLIYFFYCSFF